MWFRKSRTRIGSVRIPNWLWDLWIHLIDRLFWIVVMTDRVMTLFGMLYFLDASRGGVETYHISKGIFFLLIYRIKYGSGFVDLGFTEIPLQVKIHNSMCIPYYLPV